jgi:hypothetical protein
MNLKKLESYLRVNMLGPGPSSYKKIIYRAAVSQRLGNTVLDHTQRRTIFGRTPLDEWSARRRDLYLTTHNTYNQYPCPRWDTNPQSSAGRGPQTHVLHLAANKIGSKKQMQVGKWKYSDTIISVGRKINLFGTEIWHLNFSTPCM